MLLAYRKLGGSQDRPAGTWFVTFVVTFDTFATLMGKVLWLLMKLGVRASEEPTPRRTRAWDT